MAKLTRRTVAAVTASLALAAGAAGWATSSASAASPSIPKCSTSSLAVWVNANSGNGAAGTNYYHLDFTNISGHTCFLYGYPGVSLTTLAGAQLGVPAVRNSAVPATTVYVAPGQTAHAILGWEDAAISSACHPKTASLIKVYPPDQTAAREGFFDLTACTDHTPYLSIRRIQAGA